MDALLQRCPSTAFEQFKANPLVFLAKNAYYRWGSGCLKASNEVSSPSSSRIRVVTISDTHNHHTELLPLPDGDILIHAGDLTQSGTTEELVSALQWLEEQPHPHKLFVAGNHDKALEGSNEELAPILEHFPSLIYLNESSTTIELHDRKLLVYGSPLTPKHGSWPFQYPRDTPAEAHWSKIPRHTDILITHGPPSHHLDGGHGCRGLLSALWGIRPRLHVFGHIHAARGTEILTWSGGQAAYERICGGFGGLWDLALVCFGIVSRRSPAATTTLVNAASLGGFKDEQRRCAIIIDI